MNVWIVNHYAIPPSMGGLVRHYYFSKYLQKKGHSVKIFTSSKIHNTDINVIQDGALYKEEIEDGVEYTFVKSRDYSGNGMDRILNMIDMPFKMWRAMKCFYKKQKPDVIYTSSPDLFVAFFALLFAKIYRIPVVVEVRDLWPESIVQYNGISSKNLIILVLYQLEKWIYKRANQLVFTMEGGKEYIKDKGWDKKINLGKVHHVNNGVDLEEYKNNLEEFTLKDEDLESTDTFKAVYIGSIRKVNNVGTLIKAARYLKNNPKIQILIYGDGTEKEILAKKAEEYGGNVVFKGRIEKKYIPYILSKADVNLINVRPAGINKYGCSWNKLFEYMASGKPILCNLPVEYDLIQRHHLGVTKKFADAKEYAEAILSFYRMDKEEYSSYCKSAKEIAREYDYQILANRVEEILKAVII